LPFACLFALLITPISPLQAQKSASQQESSQSARHQQQTAAPSSQQPQDEEEAPPEEDESVAPEKFPLDPLESDRNIKVGNFYMHKGTPSGYRAALGRYERATKYNPNSAEAFFRIGQAQEKLKNKEAAKSAFERVLQLAPADSKLAREAKKKLANNKG
jgi:tetratricopeptide (TPR) repeat protein